MRQKTPPACTRQSDHPGNLAGAFPFPASSKFGFRVWVPSFDSIRFLSSLTAFGFLLTERTAEGGQRARDTGTVAQGMSSSLLLSPLPAGGSITPRLSLCVSHYPSNSALTLIPSHRLTFSSPFLPPSYFFARLTNFDYFYNFSCINNFNLIFLCLDVMILRHHDVTVQF